MSARDPFFERGLPSSVEAERLVLGAIQLDESAFILAAGNVDADDFSLEKHRRIFASMVALNERGEKIDRVTVAHELMRRGQLESVDGLSYLSSLDDGLPQIYNFEAYTRIIKEKSILRRIILNSQSLIERCMLDNEDPQLILADAEESLLKLGEAQKREDLPNPGQILERLQGGPPP